MTNIFQFRPSEHHRLLVEQNNPEMKYDGGDVGLWKGQLRSKLGQLMGEMPEIKVPLNVRKLWLKEHALGTIEKIVFTSEPHCDVPAYVCLPRNAKPPYTFVICLQGHSTGMHNSIGVSQDDEDQEQPVEGDRDFALGCMRRGIGALCIEQRAFGERSEKRSGKKVSEGCQDAAMHAMMLGRTLIGERVYDVDRGIDYLATRDDVDMGKVGVMGNSGGGTISLFSAALLDRISFAMPSCYFCTFRDSLMSIRHCTDNYMPGLLRYAEMADVMGLFAPKPVVIVAGKEDKIFPIVGVHRAFKDLKRIYRASGTEDKCHLVVGSQGHRFYADQAWPVMIKEIEGLP